MNNLHIYTARHLNQIYLEDIPYLLHPEHAYHSLQRIAQPEANIDDTRLPMGIRLSADKHQIFHHHRWMAYRRVLEEIRNGTLLLFRNTFYGVEIMGVLSGENRLNERLPLFLKDRLNYLIDKQLKRPSYRYIPQIVEERFAPFVQLDANEEPQEPQRMPIPALIYSTIHKMDDYEADDMKCGDLDVETLRNKYDIDLHALEPHPNKDLPLRERANLMFYEFRKKSKYFSWHGDYDNIIIEMINHMQENTGTPFSSPLLDEALKNQILGDDSSSSSLLKIKATLCDVIDFDNGFIPLKNKDLFTSSINTFSVLPKFNKAED